MNDEHERKKARPEGPEQRTGQAVPHCHVNASCDGSDTTCGCFCGQCTPPERYGFQQRTPEAPTEGRPAQVDALYDILERYMTDKDARAMFLPGDATRVNIVTEILRVFPREQRPTQAVVSTKFACRHCGDVYTGMPLDPCGGNSHHVWEPVPADPCPTKPWLDHGCQGCGMRTSLYRCIACSDKEALATADVARRIALEERTDYPRPCAHPMDRRLGSPDRIWCADCGALWHTEGPTGEGHWQRPQKETLFVASGEREAALEAALCKIAESEAGDEQAFDWPEFYDSIRRFARNALEECSETATPGPSIADQIGRLETENNELRAERTKLKEALLGFCIRPTLMGAYECALCGARRDRDIDMPRAHKPTCPVFGVSVPTGGTE